MSQLPENWIETNIGSVVISFDSVDPRRDPDTSITYIDIGSIDNKTQLIAEPKVMDGRDAPSRARRVVCEHDVLFATVRTYLKNIAMVPAELDGAITSTGIAVLRASGAVDPRYLFHWVCSSQFLERISQAQDGTMYPAVSDGDVGAGCLPLPPIAEQRRIVAKLDALTARTARARADLDRVPALAEAFKQRVLTGAMSGELFAHTGDSPADRVPLKSAIKRLRTGPFGSALHKHEYVEGGVPLINPMHINGGRLTPSQDMTVTAEKADELCDFRLSRGDVVIARRGVMGRCAVARADHSGWLIGTGSMAISPGPTLDADYLQLFLSSPDVVAALEANAVGTTMINLNQGVLLGLAIRLPPIGDQQRTVEDVKSAFAEIDRLVAEAASARRLLDRLDQAILAKAFRGELVPQDPADEPASILLERIRAERAAAAPAKPGRGRRAKAALT